MTPEEDFSDWETINSADYQDLPPPNVITDPFKQKWRDLKSAYKGISRHKQLKTYDLKPVIVKANDDCR